MIALQPLNAEGRTWIRERSGTALTDQARGLVAAYWPNGRILGAVAYDQWTKNSCQAHVVIEKPLAIRALLPHAFVYPFQHVGVLLGTTRAGNARVNVLAKRLGFEVTHVTLDGWEKGEALLHWELRPENCKYLKAQAR